jgi:hypothetical protein
LPYSQRDRDYYLCLLSCSLIERKENNIAALI